MRVDGSGSPHTTVKCLSGDGMGVFTNQYAEAVSGVSRYNDFGFHMRKWQSGQEPAHILFWCPEPGIASSVDAIRKLVLDGCPHGLSHRDRGCELLLGWVIAYKATGQASSFEVLSSAPAGFLYAALDAARALVPEIDVPPWFPEFPSVQVAPASHDFRG